MNEIQPPPGCPTCDATWLRRATVFDQYGFGPTEGMLFYRCIACDSRWKATTDHRYPRRSLAYPPDPIEVERDGDRVVRVGAGVHAPVGGAFNAIVFDETAPLIPRAAIDGWRNNPSIPSFR
ncbi:hypothetical protein [Curtobacterium ammoniigenes]|uniref:hypothetical protein n=1 Tax=Curtobacterium ammoniigenes TaxID=395387 RepID=UPI000A581258|nr:hypothetical protein [Curtobacterium ammoniigenes]